MKEYPYVFCFSSLQASAHCHGSGIFFIFIFFKLVHNVHVYISHLEMHISRRNAKSKEECIISEKTVSIPAMVLF